MRKTAYLVTAALLVLMVAACGSEGTSQLTYTKQVTDRKIALTSDKGAPHCVVHLEMDEADETQGNSAKAINKTVVKRLLDLDDSKVSRAIETFARLYTTDYVKNLSALYPNDATDSLKRAWYEYHYVVTTETGTGRDGVSNYVATVDYYEGGTHGVHLMQAMNFEPTTGRLLTLGDLFVPGYEQRLSAILLKALMDKTEAENMEQLHQKGYLHQMEMPIPENFVLDDETVTFLFNPDEIAPYEQGPTELTIAYGALAGILKK